VALKKGSSGSRSQKSFQPVLVKSAANPPLLFKISCSIYLQLGTIVKYLRPPLSQVTSRAQAGVQAAASLT